MSRISRAIAERNAAVACQIKSCRGDGRVTHVLLMMNKKEPANVRCCLSCARRLMAGEALEITETASVGSVPAQLALVSDGKREV